MRLGRGRPSTPRVGVRRELAIFYGAAAVALIVVSIGAVVASKSVAKSQALADAERMASRLGSLVVAPILADALNGVPGSADDLVRAINNRTKDGSLKQVTVWDRSGRIVWADDPAEIGKQLDPPPEVLEAIDDGVTNSDFEDQPEATGPNFVASEEGFVEVYTPFDVDGQTLAFEAYYDYARVDDTADGLLFELIPLVLVPLLVLMLIQVPIAASLARRIRRQDADRSALLERNLSVSEKERVRVAADLHDGPIQELAGVGYALGAVASSVPENKQPLMRDIQNTVLHAIESLRELMVDLYPPDLSVGQLPGTLENLAAPLQGKGIDIDISVTELPALDNDVVTTIYRVAHEALANVAEHADASRVSIRLGMNGSTGPARSKTVHLEVIDNGVGLDPSRLDRRSEGHLGLRLLKTRVEDLGGTLTLTGGAQGGTVVGATLPVGGRPGA
jgi:two-component system, NarL family, sensor kinase